MRLNEKLTKSQLGMKHLQSAMQVRVVFDAVTASLNSYTTKQALLTRTPNASATLESLQEEDEESSVPAGRRASDRLKASRKEVAAPVIDLLEKIVEDRSTELAQICRSELLPRPGSAMETPGKVLFYCEDSRSATRHPSCRDVVKVNVS